MPPRFKVAAIPSEDVPVPAGAEFLRAGRLELESACDSDEGPMVLIEHDVVLQSPANMVGADQIVAVSFDEGVSWWPLGGSGQSERGATDDGGYINVEKALQRGDQLFPEDWSRRLRTSCFLAKQFFAYTGALIFLLAVISQLIPDP